MMKYQTIILYIFALILCESSAVTLLFGETDDSHNHQDHIANEDMHTRGEQHSEKDRSDTHNHNQEQDAHSNEHDHEKSFSVNWTEDLLLQSQIELQSASAGIISVGLELVGKIVSYEPSVAHITPRFPGIIKEARKHLGESVNKGDVLAVIESNQSLNPYEVRSPISGVVIKRHSTVGEYASETTDIFVVADLSKVWGEFYVFTDDFGKIDVGDQVLVEAKPVKEPVVSSVSFVSKIVDEHTQSKFIRAVLENPKGLLYPGAFANALVVLENLETELIVENSALQRFDGSEVVFVWEKGSFVARPVITGKRDMKYTEIIRGLRLGERYATGNTFLIKAEIGKAEAEHVH